MAVAAGAVDLGARHEEPAVLGGTDMPFADGLPEARPSGAGLELGVRAEEIQAAPRAMIGPRIMAARERTAEGPFRAMLAQDPELLGWIMGSTAHPEPRMQRLIERIATAVHP